MSPRARSWGSFLEVAFLLSSETNIKIFNFSDPTFFLIATNFLFSSAPFQKIKVKLYMIRSSFFSIKWFFRTHFFGRSNTFLSLRYGFFESFLNFRGRFFKNQNQGGNLLKKPHDTLLQKSPSLKNQPFPPLIKNNHAHHTTTL